MEFFDFLFKPLIQNTELTLFNLALAISLSNVLFSLFISLIQLPIILYTSYRRAQLIKQLLRNNEDVLKFKKKDDSEQ